MTCPVYVSPLDAVKLLYALRSTPDQGEIWQKQQFIEVYSWQLSGNLKNIDAWASSHRDSNEKDPSLGPSIRIFKSSPVILTSKPRL